MQLRRRTAHVTLAAALIVSATAASGSDASSADPAASTSTEPGAVEPTKPKAQPNGAPVSLYFGDVDGDGLDDAFAIDPAGRVSLLLNRGEGRFEDFTVPSGLAALEGATCALLADFDGDGRVDLFVGSSEQRLWRNLGEASFEAFDSGLEHDLVDLGARAIDHDNDGRLDLALSTEAGDVLYRNARNGRFERVELPGANSVPASLPTFADADAADGAESVDANLSPSRRRLGRWIRARNAAAAAAASTNSSLSAGPNSTSTSVGNLPLAGQPSLICAGTIVDQSTLQCISASSSPALGQLYPLSPFFNVTPSGLVGIGTTTPSSALTVVAQNASNISALSGSDTTHAGINVGRTAPEFNLSIAANIGNWLVGSAPGDGVLRVNDSSKKILLGLGIGGPATMTVTSTRVGIGTTAPTTVLDVFSASDNALRVRGSNNGTPANIAFDKTAAGSQHRAEVGYRTGTGAYVSVSGADRLTIDTNGLVSVKQTLEIRGGADIVERFESSCGALEPGTVVSIDPHNPGKLACAVGAYDTKVAGVVSGAGGVQPGLCLSQDGLLDGNTPVAMNGRVYVKCTASNGAIQPGDRLTTADLAGHAMKVTDTERADGAVIGKAMTSLESGEGLVLVLVNLQ